MTYEPRGTRQQAFEQAIKPAASHYARAARIALYTLPHGCPFLCSPHVPIARSLWPERNGDRRLIRQPLHDRADNSGNDGRCMGSVSGHGMQATVSWQVRPGQLMTTTVGQSATRTWNPFQRLLQSLTAG